jgi:Ca2+-binding RTX toxin-like protein
MHSAKLKNTDSINLGAGDDSISVMVSGTYGTPSLSTMDMTLLDGGAGTDTISFEESTVASGTTLNLTTGGATNFENLTGSASIETLNGDANANTITGNGGTDTIYGNAGDDILYGYANDYMDGGASYQSGDDVLYGGSGDDQLYGTAGENTLDGGTGKDTMYGGNGADTFVLRAGDGSSVLANADVIADFQNGTDVIGMDGLNFDDLTISQGTGSNVSHTIVQHTSTSEYLAIIQNTTVNNITALDFTSTSTDAQTLTGTSGNDTLIGGAGIDTANGGAGSDSIYGWGGDDTINITGKSGAFTDTINGGAGTDTLNINYSGITSLTDFTISKSGDITTLTDSSNGVVNYESIENLSINGLNYTAYTGGYYVDGRYAGLTDVIWSPTEKILLSDGSGSIFYAGGMTGGEDSHLEGLGNSDDFEFIGDSNQDTINLNVNRS